MNTKRNVLNYELMKYLYVNTSIRNKYDAQIKHINYHVCTTEYNWPLVTNICRKSRYYGRTHMSYNSKINFILVL